MNVAKPLAKNVLAPLGLTAAMSAIDGSIQKKMHRSGATTLIAVNEDMEDIMKIIEALENSGILLKGFTKTIKNKAKEQKGGFFVDAITLLQSFIIGKFIIWQKRICMSR